MKLTPKQEKFIENKLRRLMTEEFSRPIIDKVKYNKCRKLMSDLSNILTNATMSNAGENDVNSQKEQFDKQIRAGMIAIRTALDGLAGIK